jgi:hypothetical protein
MDGWIGLWPACLIVRQPLESSLNAWTSEAAAVVLRGGMCISLLVERSQNKCDARGET